MQKAEEWKFCLTGAERDQESLAVSVSPKDEKLSNPKELTKFCEL